VESTTDSFIDAIIATDRAATRSAQLQIADNLIKVCDQLIAEAAPRILESDYYEGRFDLASEFKTGLQSGKAKLLERD
jgi:hypothetical protein